MTLQKRLVLIWAVACVVAVTIAAAALAVMMPDGSVSYATELPRSAITAPMIAVVVFWGVVRACGVPLDPMRTFVLGGLAVYGVLYFIGRVLAVSGVSPMLVLIANLAALMALAWWAVQSAQPNRR